MELRQEIAESWALNKDFCEWESWEQVNTCYQQMFLAQADKILALPEIAAGLKLLKAIPEGKLCAPEDIFCQFSFVTRLGTRCAAVTEHPQLVTDDFGFLIKRTDCPRPFIEEG